MRAILRLSRLRRFLYGSTRIFSAGMIVLAAGRSHLLAAGSPQIGDDRAFFETKIRPVLVEHCYECHSARAETLQGGLRLDTREAIRAGGQSGPAVVPGDTGQSLILDALRYESLEMPPQGKLPSRIARDFEVWIKNGAFDPRDGAAAPPTSRKVSQPKRNFWAYAPVATPVPPRVSDRAWPRTAIDRFVLFGLEAAGLAPRRDADVHTLVRRVYFDLTGLPPTVRQIDEFRDGSSGRGLAQLVDRLLASPRFGERWGRHWLDVARFAESTGGGRTRILHNAWRYRDYVISSLNADKTYDRFLTEQIAGDLLEYRSNQQRTEQLTATGFLALGPHNYELQNKPLLTMEIVDEQLATIGRAILGTSLGCARCHDHKFDPIPTRDYYALAGILRSTKSVEHDNVSSFIERPLPVSSEHQMKLDRHAAQVARLKEQLKKAETELEARKTDSAVEQQGVNSPEVVSGSTDTQSTAEPGKQATHRDTKTRIQKLKKSLAKLRQAAPQPPPRVMSVLESDHIGGCPVHLRGSVSNTGPVVPRGFVRAFQMVYRPGFPARESGRRELAAWLVHPSNPLTARVIANRIWQHLIGTGIVSTPDDFGSTGARPTHPQLLDYLAARLVRDKWSIKRLIKRIVLSRVYGLDSDARAAPRADPMNRLLWRMNRKRLEAEAMRDAILSVSGQLDLKIGGSLIDPSLKSEFGYPFSSRRRSVYVPVFRNTLHGLFEAFDFSNPNLVSGKRPTSTLATQALYMMNSPFIIKHARAAAERMLQQQDAVDDERRIELAFRQVLARPPMPAERQLAADYVQRCQGEPREQQLRTWAGLYQSLWSCIDFRYLK